MKKLLIILGLILFGILILNQSDKTEIPQFSDQENELICILEEIE